MSPTSLASCEAFSRSAQIYDLIHSGKDYDGEAGRVADLLGDSRGTLIDWGAGTGEFTRRFSLRGWDAIGIEQSMEMARIAQAKGVDVRPGDMADSLNGDGIPPAVAQTCLFAAFSYASAGHPPLLILENFRKAAAPGGRLVFDFINADAEMRAQQTRDVVTPDRSRRIRIRQYKRLVDMRLIENSIDYIVRGRRSAECSEWIETHYMRTFTAREMAELIWQAGWALEKITNTESPPAGTADCDASGSAYYLTAVCSAP